MRNTEQRHCRCDDRERSERDASGHRHDGNHSCFDGLVFCTRRSKGVGTEEGGSGGIENGLGVSWDLLWHDKEHLEGERYICTESARVFTR